MIDFRLNYPEVQTQHRLIKAELAQVYAKNLEYETDLEMVAAHWLSTLEHTIYPDQIICVCGGNHALWVISVALSLRQANVVVDPLTYNGFIKLATLLQINLVPCPVDNQGFDPEQLEAICKRNKIGAFYLIPTIHNPLAFIMENSRRAEIVKIARAFDVWIIEDDAYAFLVNPRLDAFMNLAPERTFSIHSFTKLVASSVKFGFFVVPPAWDSDVASIAKMASGGPSEIFRCLAIKWMQGDALKLLASEKRALAKHRLGMAEELLSDFEYSAQATSFHLWLPVRKPFNIQELALKIKRAGVDLLSSLDCQVQHDCENTGFRIAFGNIRSDNELIHGLEVLSRILPKRTERQK